jgi:hypothetical protein
VVDASNSPPAAGGIAVFSLTVDGEPARSGVSWPEIARALGRLHPNGPSFLVLERAGSDYVQVTGGKDAAAVEYRRYAPDGSFVHYRLGRAPAAEGLVRIASTSKGLTVPAHERLTFGDAYRAFASFFRTGSVPSDFLLRELDGSYR